MHCNDETIALTFRYSYPLNNKNSVKNNFDRQGILQIYFTRNLIVKHFSLELHMIYSEDLLEINLYGVTKLTLNIFLSLLQFFWSYMY